MHASYQSTARSVSGVFSVGWVNSVAGDGP
jgi:hypothetical protein